MGGAADTARTHFVRIPSESGIKVQTYMIAEEIPSTLVNVATRICSVFDLPCNPPQ